MERKNCVSSNLCFAPVGLRQQYFIMHAKHAGTAQAARPSVASRRYAPPYTNSSFRIGISQSNEK